MNTGGRDSEPGIPELPHETKLLNNPVEIGSLCRMYEANPSDLPKATQLLTAIVTMNSTDSKSIKLAAASKSSARTCRR